MKFEPVTNNKWFNEIGIPQLGIYDSTGELIGSVSTLQKCHEVVMALFTKRVIDFKKFESLSKEIEKSDLLETFEDLFTYICQNAQPYNNFIFDIYKNIIVTLPLGNVLMTSKNMHLRFFSYEMAIIELIKIVNIGTISTQEASSIFCALSNFELFRTDADFIDWFNRADKSLQLQLNNFGVVIAQDAPSN